MPLDSVGRIKLVNEKLDAELRQALSVLASGHDTDKKTVSAQLPGQGQAAGARGLHPGNAHLEDQLSPGARRQGAAVLARLGDRREHDRGGLERRGADAGQRPADLVHDGSVSAALRAAAAWKPELFASLRPQTYGQDLAANDEQFVRLRDGAAQAKPERGNVAERPCQEQNGRGAGAGTRRRDCRRCRCRSPNQRPSGFACAATWACNQPSAQAGDVGELFQYAIDTPVTLPRQQSAMLPIVNESVKGEKVSIYNQAVQAKHPLNGLKLINSTDLHLMQGPITVFDGGAYAGDAKIEDLPPGTERLISYALDLDTEVAPETKGQPEHLLSVQAHQGHVLVTPQATREQTYTVKNSGKKAKNVLIEYPLGRQLEARRAQGADRKDPRPYRFAVKAEPGKPASSRSRKNRSSASSSCLSNLDDNTIVFYSNQKEVSAGGESGPGRSGQAQAGARASRAGA